jgi:hypothetical protein
MEMSDEQGLTAYRLGRADTICIGSDIGRLVDARFARSDVGRVGRPVQAGDTEMNVYLDGVSVSPTAIDPTLHQYIGMFRPAADPIAALEHRNALLPIDQRADAFVCACGEHLWFKDNGKHWKAGCFDVPQYRTIQQ